MSEKNLYILQAQSGHLEPKENTLTLLIFPRGEYFIERYDRRFSFDDRFFVEIIANFQNPALFKPFIDKNHEMRESYGEILELAITEEGLSAKIHLNEKGMSLVEEREFRYVSPTFGQLTDNAGQSCGNTLYSVSLTNTPALNGTLPQIQQQLKLEQNPNFDKVWVLSKAQDVTMTPILVKLGLPIQSDQKTILDRIDLLMLENSGLKEDKTRLENHLAEMEMQNLRTIAETVVLEAIHNGQYHPALREHKIGEYLENPERVRMELELIPKKKAGERKSQSFGGEPQRMNEEDRKVMLERGLDPHNESDYRLYSHAQSE